MGIDDGKPLKHYGINAGSPVRFRRPTEPVFLRQIDHEEPKMVRVRLENPPDWCDLPRDKEGYIMPLKYNPDTGIPSYVPDLGEELEEGVTPEPKVIELEVGPVQGRQAAGQGRIREAARR